MSPRTRFFVVLLCTIPGSVFAYSLLAEHRAYFWDGTVYRCAIEASLATGTPYRFIGDCAGYFLPHTYPYGGTQLLARIASILGRLTVTYGYALAYASGVLLFAHVIYRLGGSLWVLLLVLLAPGAGVFVSELVSGNVAIPFYGLLLWLICRDAPNFGRIAALGAAMAPFKPLYSAYLIIPFLLRRDVRIPAVGAGLVAAWYAGDVLLFPAHFAEWLGVAVHHANEVPGFGFTMLIRKGGLELGGKASIAAAYLVWAGVIGALTLRAVARSPTPLIQALAAIAGTALLLPRLKEYDCLILIPLALAVWPAVSARERREWGLLVGGFAAGLPATIWWLRKLPLLWSDSADLWRAFVDMRWLVQNQGGFLFAALLAALVWLAARPRACRVAEADAAQPATADR